jgi:GT2 family glycosyltransferase
MAIAVSVIICTKDPRSDIFARAVDSIDRQTLAKERFELIVVDNNSCPPLDAAALRGNRAIGPIVLQEPQQGLSYARCTGIAAAKGDLFVFVDDDNFLASDYLEQSLRIAEREAGVGLFGGIAEVELERPIPKWKEGVLPYLGVRNHGDKPITAFADHWGEWEPIGAGMVARREVAEKFVEMFRTLPDARQLGRSGTSLLSGEDSLFARAAHRCGFSCSYQPALKLTHYMKQSRLRLKYLAKLMEGHGRSYVLLHRALGKPTDPLKVRTAVARLGFRIKTKGRAGVLTWFWDLGYALEKRNDAKPAAVEDEHAGEAAGHGA